MKISVVTATFNSARTVRDTLESVLRQTYPDVELIVKDGGSTDATLDICREYEPRFEGRMRILSGPDKGIYDAMNQGIEAATGDVVGLLNSDDFYSADDIMAVVAATLAETGCDAVYGDIHFVSDKDLTRPIRYYSSAGFRRERMMQGWMPAHPSFYCRRDIYLKFGLFDTSFPVAADFEQLLRLIYIHCISTRYIARDFVTMRIGGSSTKSLGSRFQIMKDHLRAFRKNGIPNNALRLSSRYLSKVFEYFR